MRSKQYFFKLTVGVPNGPKMRTPSIYKKVLGQLLLFFLLIALILPWPSHPYDMACWREWGKYVNEGGIGNIYKTWANYPPIMFYILYFFDWLNGFDPGKIDLNMNYIKLFPLFFDLVPVLILVLIRKAADLKKGTYFFLIFNIAYLYNSVVWGQVDSIHTTLVLCSVFLCYRYPAMAISFFVLALNMKLQAIVFFPIVLLCISTKIDSLKIFWRTIFAAIVTQTILLIPFFMAHTLEGLWKMIVNSNGYAPLASVNAFNLWYLFLNDPLHTSDSVTLYGLTYKHIGLLLFFLMSTLVLFPLIVKTLRVMILGERPKSYEELVFLCTGMIALIFFFFNTEMHERYSHPAMIFLFFYGLYRRNFLLYVLVSAAYLLNIEKIMKFYIVPYHTLIFDAQFIAGIFLLTILLGTISIYKNYNLGADLRVLKGRLSLKRLASA